MIRRALRRFLGIDALEADLVRLRTRVDPLGNYPAWHHLNVPAYAHRDSGEVTPIPYLARGPVTDEYGIDVRGMTADEVAVAVRDWMERAAQKLTEKA